MTGSAMANLSRFAPPLWRRRWFGPAALSVAAAVMLAWTWGTWPDALVDFGVQLYVPWRLAAGDVLYRDIAHYTGPLSVYYNALVFRLFGPSLRVLVLANLPCLAGIAAAIYFLTWQMAGRMAAVACGLSFILLFAFAHPMPGGNYNYVCPYEYDYTHGMLLCLACLIFLGRVLQSRRSTDAAIAGLLAGMVFLTRAELFVAVAAASGLGLLLVAIEHRESGRVAVMLSFVAAALVPVALSVGLLTLAEPLPTAVRGTLGMWPALLRGDVAHLPFYRHSMGLDHLHRSMALMMTWSGVYLAIAGALVMWAMPRRWATASSIAAATMGAALVGCFWKQVPWISAFRPLPLIALAVVIWAMIAAVRSRGDRCVAARTAMFAMLALVLLGKIFFYARIVHYGCWLAMPATMLLVAAVFGWIPATIQRAGGNAAVYLAGAAGLWGAVLAVHLMMTATAIGQLTQIVGSGGDAFRAPPWSIYVNRVVAAARQIISPDQTLNCFPEGIMINYLARRRAASPYVNYNPPDLLLFGEQNMLEALRRRPPDYILIVHKDTREFGVRFFGTDYGRELFAWIASHYQPEPLPVDLGAVPLREDRFGIRLLAPRAAQR